MEDKLHEGTLYRHYTRIKLWEKNQEITTISTANWLKLIASIKKHGVMEDLQVGDDDIAYDGNHRLKATIHIVESEGITVAENGVDLTYLPIKLVHPKTEADKWHIALMAHSEYREWNKDGIANYSIEFENELDLSLINIDFSEPISLDSIVDVSSEPNDKKETNPTQVTCPQCQHQFTI